MGFVIIRHTGAFCIVQRTEKSLLYETGRALRVPLPVFVAGCLKYGLVVVPRCAIWLTGGRRWILDFGVRASKCTVQLAREVLVRTILSWISAC